MSYNRQQLVINDFGGVDLSSSPLQVHSSRASFATNLIKDNGVNHKRPGWNQIGKLGGRINGMYHYVNGSHNVLIVYEGTSFRRYQVLSDGSLASLYDNITKVTYAFDLIDNRVQFFLFKERLYIIGCGEFLVYGEFEDGYELKRVSDIAYVPTVIIGAQPEIVHVDEAPEHNDYGVESVVQEYSPGIVHDALNIIRRDGKRKEEFLVSWSFTTDYCLFPTLKPFRECNVYVGDVLIDPTEYTKQQSYDLEYGIGKEDKTIYDTVYIHAASLGWAGNVKETVTIEYTPYDFNYEGDTITNSCIGVMFGAYGNADRLFLSGNPSMPNVDYYSGYEDFTYFSANSRTVMGSDDQPITGYLRLSDSTLATFKDSSYTEPTVYYRTATETVVELENGEKTSDVAFTRWTGGIGEGCISPYCLASLAGDELMLSENGLFGIVQTENVATNDRYFRERDRYINARLRRCSLANATATVYKNRYYLAVDDVCFVADPRFKTYLSDDIDGSFNYEWWYWENIPARVFAILGDKLCFGTDDGKICVFDDKFTDRTYDNTVNGQLTADGDKLIHESAMDVNVCDGDEIELSGYSGRLYVTGYKASECTFKVSKVKGGTPIANIRTELGIGTSVTALTMKVWCYKNVVSRWFTPVFDLGAFDLSKTLLSMTVTLDPSIRGKLRFGYEIKHAESLTEGGTASDGSVDLESGFVFDFYGMASGLLSFDSGFTSSYTVKVKARHFNYIMFKFISDTDTDCAVHNFKATYVINGRNRGTR